MQYWRCKCGKNEHWTTMGVPACDKCPYCGTRAAPGPDSHVEPKSHEFVKDKHRTDDGSLVEGESRCIHCHRTKRQIEAMESESKKGENDART